MKKRNINILAKTLRQVCACLAFCMLLVLCVRLNGNLDNTTQARDSIAVSGTAKAEEELSLYATAAVLMDADSGRVLYSKNGKEAMPMASTTKILTCIIALEKGNLEDEVEISSYATTMPKVKLYVKEGEHYRLRDLLYSLMLESHNDAAVAIAEHIGGSVEEFAGMMNEKATEIGCENSFFITPNGLDAVNNETGKVHSSSAEDMAKIMAYCIGKSEKAKEFLEITRTSNYCFTNTEGRSFSCTNHNAFLSMMEGAVSGKTGFTNQAGYCYVGALERDGEVYTLALLACGWPNHKTWKWADSKLLFQYGLDHYEYRSFEEVEYKETQLKEIPVINGKKDSIDGTVYVFPEIIKEENARERLLLGEGEQIQVHCKTLKSLEAPVEKGRVIGEIIYSLDGEIYRKDKILSKDAVGKIDLEWCFEKILEKFIIKP